MKPWDTSKYGYFLVNWDIYTNLHFYDRKQQPKCRIALESIEHIICVYLRVKNAFN